MHGMCAYRDACSVHRACASGIRCAQAGTGMAQYWVPLVSRDLGLGWWLARWARDGTPLCAYYHGVCSVCVYPGMCSTGCMWYCTS